MKCIDQTGLLLADHGSHWTRQRASQIYVHHDLDLTHGGGDRDAIHPEELQVCFDILTNHIRVSINDVIVALARSDQRVLALQGVRMLVICGHEDTSVGDDERSQHPLMVRHDTPILGH